MYPPPPPARNWNSTKHECYRKKIILKGHQVHFTIYPPPFHYHFLIEQETGYGYMDPNPICHLSPAKKKWNAHFWIKFNFWWSARLVNELVPHLQPLSSQQNEMLIFGLHSTSYDLPGWSNNSNPVYHASPTKKMKCSFLDYVQLLIISQAIRAKNVKRNIKKWKRPPKSSKNKMFIFGLCSTSDDQ